MMVRSHFLSRILGETRIANKFDSWVTMIQVYEYYLSHHLAKSFESLFGGVTCLPGCFSMYRIKVRKGPPGFWVPVLVNPDVVEEYSQNIVESKSRLHSSHLHFPSSFASEKFTPFGRRSLSIHADAENLSQA